MLIVSVVDVKVGFVSLVDEVVVGDFVMIMCYGKFVVVLVSVEVVEVVKWVMWWLKLNFGDVLVEYLGLVVFEWNVFLMWDVDFD